MARMIPSFVEEQTPPGEREVFNLLSAGPANWVIMHSLDLAPWNRSRRTEIDFVVIIPDAGILCIEVKSHAKIAYDGERWYPTEIKKSPFKQAADGRFAFYRRIRDLAPQFACVPVVHCCIFTSAIFNLPPNMSVAAWELMDNRAFRALSTAEAFCSNLSMRINQSIDADPSLYPLLAALSKIEVGSIVDACVPVQKRRHSLREDVARREEQAAKILREHQRPVLLLSEQNDRLIISGGAGTGKTLIAMEIARRAAERGRRVALLCFNQLVGDWMRQVMAPSGSIPPNLVVGRAIRVMAELTEVAIPTAPTQTFWENDLPQMLEERLSDPDLEVACAFDYIVIDEAQDLMARPRLWDCLTHFLHGGVENGNFAIFGDFDYQVLKDHQPVQAAIATIEKLARPVRWHLSENCRNYQIVGETALRLSGMPASVYSGYLRHGGGLHNYNIMFYESRDAQVAQLRQWLREFRELGYKASEITLLSFRADEASAAVSLKRTGYSLRPGWQHGEGTAYASVHAFKGMENKVIILTDVLLTDQTFHRDVFYTGMTRATECIRVLCDRSSEALLCGWLAGKTGT